VQALGQTQKKNRKDPDHIFATTKTRKTFQRKTKKYLNDRAQKEKMRKGTGNILGGGNREVSGLEGKREGEGTKLIVCVLFRGNCSKVPMRKREKIL